MISRNLVVLSALTVAVSAIAGCAGATVINTGDMPAPSASAPSPAPPTRSNNAHLVNAFDYVGHVGDTTGYYFTTPSGKWRCAILTHDRAGCQAASGWQSGLGVKDEPDATNAVIVDEEGDPQFVTLEAPDFWLQPGPAHALQFNKILAAAGFRCDVSDAGVSCQSDTSGKGFTLSADRFTPQYTDVPFTAP
ncbi:MAG: hypothetical protein NVS4B6_26470 [Mycobacterium sp.]